MRVVLFGLLLTTCAVVQGWSPLSSRAAATTYIVDDVSDSASPASQTACTDNVAGGCTLRAAVILANANVGADTIQITNGNYLLTIGELDEEAAATGDLDILDSVTIEPLTANTTPLLRAGVNAFQGIDRLFDIRCASACSVSLRDVSLANGGGSALFGQGGAIRNNAQGALSLTRVSITGSGGNGGGGAIGNPGGSVTLTNATFNGNSSSTGGALYNSNGGTMTVINSAVNGGVFTTSGGGIYNEANSTVTVTGGTISNNTATNSPGPSYGTGGAVRNLGTLTLSEVTLANNLAGGEGGAIYNGGTLIVESATFLDNSSDTVSGTPANGARGGAIYSQSGATVEGSTFTGNTADADGGAVYSRAALTLTNSTFENNDSGLAGGVSIYHENASDAVDAALINLTITGGDSIGSNSGLGDITLVNTIIDTCGHGSTNLVSLGNNMGLTSSCTTMLNAVTTDDDQVEVSSPLLGTLADNGGPTQTRALQPGSPAIGAADNADCPATDQRGVSRPQHVTCDIGAFETEDNRPVVANDDALTTNEDQPKNLAFLLNNDTDQDQEPLSIVGNSDPAHGAINCVSGNCTYTPDQNYFGGDAFTYTVSDGFSTDTANVAVTVNSVNDKPVAVDDQVVATTTIQVTFNVGLNDPPDVEGDDRTWVRLGEPTNGTARCQSNGVCTYTSFVGFTGTDDFTYRVRDDQGGFDTGLVTITVRAKPRCRGLEATIFGKTGTINGTGGNDVIVGSSAVDTIDGRGGADTICGGGGNDVIKGGTAADTLDGGGGNDDLAGGSGSDTLFGNAGNDHLSGGTSSGDQCNGNTGDDTADASCETVTSATIP
ncbi:MAG: Ig-like domain-containing protein [Dehalococcoidia bacterium]